MRSIDQGVMVHGLSINPTAKLMQQKTWEFHPLKESTITKKVKKLLQAQFTCNVHYLKWLANLVIVKNGKQKVEYVYELHQIL